MKAANVKVFTDFIIDRHAVYLRKAAGAPKPWTEDPILQQYKFCNVYRELDSTTVWIADHWRTPHQDDPELWFAMLVARLINWPPTLEALGYPVPWNHWTFCAVLAKRKDLEEKVYSSAYMITTCRKKMNKLSFNTTRLSKIWEIRDKVRPQPGESLMAFHTRLMSCYGVGSFLAGQVVADTKYTPLLRKCEDWDTFAASGPGSRRGLTRVLGQGDVLKPWQWREEDWHAKALELRAQVNVALPAHMAPLHAQDLQNCLCEWDKYRRIIEATKRFRMMKYPGRKGE